MVTRPRDTKAVAFEYFSHPAALQPLALRAALAVVLVTQIFSNDGRMVLVLVKV